MKIENAKVGMRVITHSDGYGIIKAVAPRYDSRQEKKFEYSGYETGCEVTRESGDVVWFPVDWLNPVKRLNK